MAGTDDQNLGEWHARPVAHDGETVDVTRLAVPEANGAGHGPVRPGPDHGPGPGPDPDPWSGPEPRSGRDPRSGPEPRSGRDPRSGLALGAGPASEVGPAPQPADRDSFWRGLLLGLVPLALLLAGVAGYIVADRGESTTEAVSRPVDTTPVATTPPASEALPTSAGGPGGAVEPSISGPVEASGVVTRELIELDGTVPAAVARTWSTEIAALADALDHPLVDRTVAAADAQSGELLLTYPGAVIYTENSPDGFDGSPHEMFDAVAEAIVGGTFDLTVVAYADPGRPEDAHLALFRAEHVHEHLLELDVDPGRLAVEVRRPEEAAGDGGSGPVDRRADLEFHFQS